MKFFGLEINSSNTIKNLKENFADISRQFEDFSWISFSGLSNSRLMFKERYQEIVAKSRSAYSKNPIVGHAINLTTDYVFGEGITTPKASSPDEENKENEEVQEILDKFWDSLDNKLSLTSSMAQRALSNKLQYDGEIDFRLFVDPNGDVFVRILDPLNTQPIHDKGDPMRVNFWIVRQGLTKMYIPDVSNGIAFKREELPETWLEQLRMHGISENEVLQDQYIFHVQINADINDDRGVPIPWRSIDWVNDHSRLHSDMSSFIHAQAQYAWKKKVKGSKSQIQGMKARGQQNSRLTNPSNQAGSTIIENAAVDNSPIDLKAGSGQLFTLGIKAAFRMITVSFGLFEHYFGDLGNANLATAKSVELPMLKKFRSLQKFWEDTIKAILWFQLDMKLQVENKDSFEYIISRNRLVLKPNAGFKKGRFIDIDFPPILQKEIKDLADAWSIAKKEGLAPIETARTQYLLGAGINNIEEEMQKEYQEPAASPSPFGPAPEEKKVTEAAKKKDEGVRPKGFIERRKEAVKLADKNQVVLVQMNQYIREIGIVYRKMKSAIRGSASVKESGVKIKGLRSKLNTFKEKMNILAEKNFPVATEIGKDYIAKHIDITEVKEQLETVEKAFVAGQVKQNLGYLDGLTDDMFKKLDALSEATFISKTSAEAALVASINSFEKRIGSYGGFYWTVEERAVQTIGESKAAESKVVFVGVDDAKNCPGCTAALEGNPWTMKTVPIPGEQDCLTACRHAIQVEGDEDLTEADVQLLRDEETRARDGYILESDRSSYGADKDECTLCEKV